MARAATDVPPGRRSVRDAGSARSAISRVFRRGAGRGRRADGTSSGLRFGCARAHHARCLRARRARHHDNASEGRAARCPVRSFDVPRLREVAAKPSSAAAHRGALAALRGHRAHAARCFQSRARHPRNAQDRRVCGILRCGVPLLHARPRRRAPGRRGGDCGDGRCAVGARSRNRRRAVRTLYRASHRPAHRRPSRRAEPTFGLLRDRGSDAGRLGARSILGAR